MSTWLATARIGLVWRSSRVFGRRAGRAMGTERCPDALRAKIERIAAESNPAYGEGIEVQGAVTRSSSFWNSPRFVGVVGAAAAIALMFVVGGVLVTQSGSSAPGSIRGGAGGELAYGGYLEQVSRFVSNESERCWDNDAAADRKFVMKDRDTVVAEFRDLLKGEMRIPALDQPVESLVFRGGGHCRVPKTQGAAHLQWDIPAQGDEPAAAVSMFVAPDNGMLPVEEGRDLHPRHQGVRGGGHAGSRLEAERLVDLPDLRVRDRAVREVPGRDGRPG